MSRCFPFPPPGYEKKFKAENLDLLTKEKHREKRHKKEKREKEKKEHKDKKEKDRNKDKHKDKKDRKEKHKERKKGKDIDKGRTPGDNKAENRTEGQNELHVRESCSKAEEIKDSKFAEEFGRRTRDDGATNQLVKSITSSSIHRKFERAGTGSPSLEKESGADKKLFQIHNIGSAQRNYGSGQSFEDVANSLQRRAENTSTATSLEKERSKMHEKLTVGISSEPNRNNGSSRPDIIPRLVNRKTEYSTAEMENERSEKDANPNCIVSTLERGQLGAKFVASTSASTQRRNNDVGLSEDNLLFHCKNEVMANSSIHNRMEGMCSVPTVEKERIKGMEMFPRPGSSEQRTKTSIGQLVEKDSYQKLDGKDKNENKKYDGRKGLKDGDNIKKKSKPMDAVRHCNEMEKKEKITKGEEIETDKTKFFGKKDKIDTLNSKPLAPHKDMIRDLDMNMKKSKDLKTNGFLHENDVRPSKIPRLTLSAQPPVNDRTLDLHLDAPFSLSLKDGAMNNMKPDRTLDNNNEKKINGSANSQQLAIEARPPSARGLLENGDVSMKLPHPDSKYLHQIYTVPKMEPWLEADDLDWLLECYDSQQKPKTTKREAENVPAPQVWAQALQIDDSANDFALPYVVPF